MSFRAGSSDFEEVKRMKPKCKLIGEDGNVFNLIAIASRVLRRNQMSAQATEMQNRIYACGSYDEALSIIQEYVEVY